MSAQPFMLTAQMNKKETCVSTGLFFSCSRVVAAPDTLLLRPVVPGVIDRIWQSVSMVFQKDRPAGREQNICFCD